MVNKTKSRAGVPHNHKQVAERTAARNESAALARARNAPSRLKKDRKVEESLIGTAGTVSDVGKKEINGRSYRVMQFTQSDVEFYGIAKALIVGTAPYMQQNFSETAQERMRMEQEGAAASLKPKKKTPRNFERECIECMHVIGPSPKSMDPEDMATTRWGAPANAFAHAIIAAIAMTGGEKKGNRPLIRSIPSEGSSYLVEIIPNGLPEMDIRYAKVNNRAHLRARPLFQEGWAANIEIRFSYTHHSVDAIALFLRIAGDLGIGSLRPGGENSSGPLGTWAIDDMQFYLPDLA